jgi:hypothetical protein
MQNQASNIRKSRIKQLPHPSIENNKTVSECSVYSLVVMAEERFATKSKVLDTNYYKFQREEKIHTVVSPSNSAH